MEDKIDEMQDQGLTVSRNRVEVMMLALAETAHELGETVEDLKDEAQGLRLQLCSLLHGEEQDDDESNVIPLAN